MADYCKQCHEEHAFPGENDGKGLCEPKHMVGFLCEGCGHTFVDHEGRCLSKNCLCRHGGHITLTNKCRVCGKEYEINQRPGCDRRLCGVHWNARIDPRRST